MKSNEAALLEVFRESKEIVFLTGAGVSTDSGIPDFQTLDEHWNFPVDRKTAISRRYFDQNRAMFWKIYRHIFSLKSDVAPNGFHLAVAELEKNGKKVTVYTQNIDGLHAEAGSTTFELHGNLRDVICHRMSCQFREPMNDSHDEKSRCPVCRKPLRPDVVLFGEVPRHYYLAEEHSVAADLLVVAGASLEVFPVAQIPAVRNYDKPEAPMVWANREQSPPGYRFSHELVGELSSLTALLDSI